MKILELGKEFIKLSSLGKFESCKKKPPNKPKNKTKQKQTNKQTNKQNKLLAISRILLERISAYFCVGQVNWIYELFLSARIQKTATLSFFAVNFVLVFYSLWSSSPLEAKCLQPPRGSADSKCHLIISWFLIIPHFTDAAQTVRTPPNSSLDSRPITAERYLERRQPF